MQQEKSSSFQVVTSQWGINKYIYRDIDIYVYIYINMHYWPRDPDPGPGPGPETQARDLGQDPASWMEPGAVRAVWHT